MKVALNGTALLSPLTGLGQYTYHLVKSLQDSGQAEVELFYGGGWNRELRSAPTRGIVTMKSLAKRFLPNPYALSRFVQQRTFNRGIRALKPQIYHEPNFLAFKAEIPSVITVHDLSWIRFPHTHPIERVRAMDTYFEKGLRRAALVLTDSVFVKNELMEVFGIGAERIRPIMLGVESLFRPQTADETLPVLQKLALTHGEYLLAVGTLEPRKNLKVVLRAFAQLPAAFRKRHPLVLVGMKGWHTSEFEAQIAPLVQAGEVRELGYLPREDLATVIAGATTLIYPSIYEGFGLPPLEAMACGVPVITSNVSSIPEVVGDAGIMLAPHDVDGIADAIRLVAEDADVRRDLAVKALLRSAEFTWGKCAEQTVEAYRDALKGGAAA